MPLPRPALATGSVELDGTSVELRAMTFNEAMKLRGMESESDRAAFMVACSTGLSVAEANEWMDAVPTPLVADLVIAIVKLSGLEATVTVGPKALPDSKPTNGSLSPESATPSTTS